MNLKGKKIILGVTGSIAAYKSALLIRLLVKKGAQVKVIMTPSAKDFITPLTLATLSKNPILSEFVENKETGRWTNHVDLGLWADLFLIAPASANTIAKMAYGICDDLLLAVYLSAKCPVMVAPAMDLDMFKHPATQQNLQTLKSYNNTIIEPGTGELASGLFGQGRMAEPEEIIAYLENNSDSKKKLPLSGKTFLVSAGPTYEAIDPVRFIGNHSSGKMGFAIAEELAKQGAKVNLVCGPNNLLVKHPSIIRTDVVSANEMYNACTKLFKKADGAIMSAAVADFTPISKASNKIKKGDSKTMELSLKATTDILAELGKQKTKKQLLVGFALETNNEIENAKKKLKSKNLDFIVLNSTRNKGAGFGYDTNKITVIDKRNKTINFDLKNKTEVAVDIVTLVTSFLK